MKKPSRHPFKFPNLRKLPSRIVRPIPWGIVLTITAGCLLGYALFSHMPFLKTEDPHTFGAATLSEIKNNILLGPLKVLQFGILKAGDNDVYLRIASAATALVSAILMYLMLRKWHPPRISFLASLMFATSSLFLHLGRLANTEVLYLTLWPALLLSCMWFLSKNNTKKLPVVAFLLAACLYVPGTWLFLLGGLIFFRKYTWRTLSRLSLRIKLLCASLFLLTLVPLGYSFWHGQRQAVEWLGFDLDQKLSLAAIAGNFIDIPKQLFWSGLDEPSKWLVGTPILDIFAVAMLILGIYAYWAGYYPAREKLVYGAIVLSVLLIGLGNVATIALLVPLLYIVIANGLAYMLQSWFTVFPNNPFARSLGIVLLAAAVGISSFYQLNRYFVAWPEAESTQTVLSSRE